MYVVFAGQLQLKATLTVGKNYTFLIILIHSKKSKQSVPAKTKEPEGNTGISPETLKNLPTAEGLTGSKQWVQLQRSIADMHD